MDGCVNAAIGRMMTFTAPPAGASRHGDVIARFAMMRGLRIGRMKNTRIFGLAMAGQDTRSHGAYTMTDKEKQWVNRFKQETHAMDVLPHILDEIKSNRAQLAALLTLGGASDQGDFYMIKACEWIRQGLQANDGRAEIRTLVRAAARVIVPRMSVEVGVRYGWSTAQIASEADGAIACVDIWEKDYAGLPTKGPHYARSQVEKMAPQGNGSVYSLTFYNGDSHMLLPGVVHDLPYFPNGKGTKEIDLAVVDGDHTAVGTWWDIVDLMPYIAVGGALIMDDLFDTAHELQLGRQVNRASMPFFHRPEYPLGDQYSILKLWRHLPKLYPNFVYYDNAGDAVWATSPHGVAPCGICVRVS